MINNLIKKIKLPKIAKKHPIAFWTTIVLHLALVIGIVFSNTQRWEIPQQKIKPITKPVIKAFTINNADIEKERQRIVNNKKKRLDNFKKEQQALKRIKNEKAKAEREFKQTLKKNKLEEAKARKAEEKRTREAKKKTKAEEKKTREAKKKAKLEEKKAREAKKKTKAEERKAREAKIKTKAEENKTNEAKKKTKLEEKKTREAKKKTKTEEKKTKLAEQEKNKIEKLRKLEAKKFAKEQGSRSLKKEIQAEEDQEREIAQEDIIEALKISWINQIAAKIRGNWRNNFSAKDDWVCDVDMLQDRKGEVLSVNVHSCNVNNDAKAKVFIDSIERAVNKSSPLPLAPDKDVFDKEILFHFRVN
jgi:colicin import membrane protein